MKTFVNIIKSLLIFCVILTILVMAYLKRDFLWDQTRMARAFYYVWQGDENIKKNDFQKSIDFYKTALKIYPEHPKAHYNLGNIYFWYEVYTAPSEKQPVKIFKYDEKIDRFVLHIEPPKKDDDSENSAEAAYIRATEVSPTYINAWINLGLVRLNKYDLDGARKSFLKAIYADPTVIDIPFIFNNKESINFNRAVAYYNLGHTYKQMAFSSEFDDLKYNYIQEALKYYKKSYEINPNSYKTNYNLAQTYQLLKLNPTSINLYCKAIKIDPFKYEAHYNLGVLLKNEQRYIAAAEELKKAAMLLDYSKHPVRAEYIFRVLRDASLRAAAVEQNIYNRSHSDSSGLRKSYPIPKKGIIAEVIGEPLLEQKKLEEEKKLKEEAESNENNDDQTKPSTSLELTEKYFSKCVTDIDYIDDLRKEFTDRTDWIRVDKELYVPEVENQAQIEEI